MISQNYNNISYGQVVHLTYDQLQTILCDMNDKYFVFYEKESGQQQLRVYIDSGKIFYQTFNTQSNTWNPQQLLTPDIFPLDSNTLPLNPGQSFIQITDSLFKVTMLGQQKMLLQNNQLIVALDKLKVINLLDDFEIYSDMSSGKKVIFIDNSIEQPVLQFSQTNLDLLNKPILNIAPSTDPTSAVTLQQLTNTPSNNLLFGSNNRSEVFNLLNQPVFSFYNTQITSALPLRYSVRPSSFVNQDIVDAQFVLDSISSSSPSLDQISNLVPTAGNISMQNYNILKVGSIVGSGISDLIMKNEAQNTGILVKQNDILFDFPNLGDQTSLKFEPQPDMSIKQICDNGILLQTTGSTLECLPTQIKSYVGDENTGNQLLISDKIYFRNCDVDVGGFNLKSIADPVDTADAISQQYADGRYYLNTDPLNIITAPIQSLSLNSQKIIDLADATSGTDALNRQTGDGRYYLGTTTLNNITLATGSLNVNSQKITGLQNGTVNGDAVNYGQLTNFIPTLIQDTTTNSSLNCIGANQINIKANGNNLGYFFQPIGQSTTPLGLLTTDKMQFQSGMNSFTFYGNNATPSGGLVYNAIRSQMIDVPTSNCYSGVEITSSGSATLNACMTLVSGHSNIFGDGVQRPFMAISDQNNATNTILSISCVNPVLQPTNTSYTQYTSSMASSLLLPQHSFQGSAGYNATTSITQNNQFTSKQYVDTRTINTLASQTADYSFGNFKLTNLANATVATDALNRQTGDSRYYLNTTTLDNLTLTAGPLNLNSQRIIGLANATAATDALNRQTGDGRYYLNTTTLNSITAPTTFVSLNSQKISSLANPTAANDAVNLTYLQTNNYTKTQSDARYYLGTTTLNNITLATGSLNMNAQKIIGLGNPSDPTDASTKGYVDTQISAFSSDQIKSTTTNTKITVSDTNNLTRFTNNGINSLDLDDTSLRPLKPIDMGNLNKIIRLVDPSSAQDACTKAYADSLVGASTTTMPVGSILAWYSNLIPSGWLLCNGQSFSSSLYPDLFAVLGGTTVPDFRGYFLRGLEASATPSVETDVNRTLGSIQSDIFKSHNHQGGAQGTVPNGGRGLMQRSGGGDDTAADTDVSAGEPNLIAPPTFIPNEGGLETRPKNRAVNYIIRVSITGTSEVAGVNPSVANLDFQSAYKGINSIDPSNPQDLATKNYVDTQLGNVSGSEIKNAIVTTSKLTANQTELTNGTTPLNMNNQIIRSLGTPSSGTDATTKSYVDNLLSQSAMPVGGITAWYSTTTPTGWLLCNGQSFNVLTYPDLFAVLGTNTVPDFRGYFLRGLDTTGVVDPSGASRIIGSVQSDLVGQHTHSLSRRANPDDGAYDSGNGRATESSAATTDRPIVGTFNTSSFGGVETRPKNRAVNYIIRALISGNSQVAGINPTAANLDLQNTFKVTNSLNPTNPQDLATKNYVDGLLTTQERNFIVLYVNSLPALNSNIASTNVLKTEQSTSTNLITNNTLSGDVILTIQPGSYKISMSVTTTTGSATNMTIQCLDRDANVPLLRAIYPSQFTSGNLDKASSIQAISTSTPTNDAQPNQRELTFKTLTQRNLSFKLTGNTGSLNYMYIYVESLSGNNITYNTTVLGEPAHWLLLKGGVNGALTGSFHDFDLTYTYKKINGNLISCFKETSTSDMVITFTPGYIYCIKSSICFSVAGEFGARIQQRNITTGVMTNIPSTWVPGTNTALIYYDYYNISYGPTSTSTQVLDQDELYIDLTAETTECQIKLLTATSTNLTTVNVVSNNVYIYSIPTTYSIQQNVYSDRITNQTNSLIVTNSEITSSTIINAGVNKVKSSAIPTVGEDLCNKTYIDTALSNVSGGEIKNAVITTSKLTANQTELTNGTTPLNMNSQKITNLATPTVSTDGVNRAYVDSLLVASPLYTTSINPTGPGQTFTITHNLGQTLQFLDIQCNFILKTAVNGFSIGNVIEVSNFVSDISQNGKSHGLAFGSINSNSISLILGSYAVANVRKTGGDTDTASFIDFADVTIYIKIKQASSPTVLQANSLNTSQLVVNSSVDFATGGYKVQSSNPTNPTDVTNKNYVDSLMTSSSYVYDNATLANQTTYTITHNLGITLTSLSIEYWVQFLANNATSGFSSTEWINIQNTDRVIAATGVRGVQFYEINTNSISMQVGNEGFGIVDKNNGGFNTFNANLFRIRVNLAPLSGAVKLVTGAYNTNSLVVNSSLDFATGGYKVQSSNPTTAQDVVTLNYIANMFRTGTVVIGDIGSTGTRSRTVTGSILTAQQSNAYGSGDSFIDITFANVGFTPLLFLQWSDPTNSSICNDVNLMSIQSRTSTSARIYIEDSTGNTQNGTLFVMIVAPAM